MTAFEHHRLTGQFLGPQPAFTHEPAPWTAHAACKGQPVEQFYRSGPPSPETAARCTTCPVQTECLNWAIRHNEHGYWAGTTPEDRRTIRRQRRHHAA